MRRLLLPVFGLFCACSWAFGQVGTEKQPVEITASGDTNYENGLATAHGNVVIHAGDADIYADKATYNPKTHDIVAEGHVRIYRTVGTFVGERAIYNTESKEIKAVNIKTDKQPYLVAGETSPRFRGRVLVKGVHDARFGQTIFKQANDAGLRNDRVIFSNVTFVRNVRSSGSHMYQSLDDSFSYGDFPGLSQLVGPSVLSRVPAAHG
jgi:lipopolysaccharide export system protein LptA